MTERAMETVTALRAMACGLGVGVLQHTRSGPHGTDTDLELSYPTGSVLRVRVWPDGTPHILGGA